MPKCGLFKVAFASANVEIAHARMRKRISGRARRIFLRKIHPKSDQFLVSGLLLFFAAITTATPTTGECQNTVALANQTAQPLTKLLIALHEKLIRQNPNENIVYSPASIALALALAESGAGGQTQTELKQWLAPRNFNGDVSALYQSLQRQLRVKTDEVTLSVANGLFYHQNFTLAESYLNEVKKCFDTAIEPVNFAESEAARQKINTWISNATAQKIPELIKPRVLTAATKAVLANAIYLKAAWQDLFRQTEDRKFYSLAQEDKAKTVRILVFRLRGEDRVCEGGISCFQVKFMVRTGTYKYASNEHIEILEIPYKGAPISMYIIKAKAPKTGIAAAEPSYKDQSPLKVWESAAMREVALKLPRFMIRLPTDLTEILQQLGVSTMFSDASADFSRMDPQKRLKVSSVVHEAYIKVCRNNTSLGAVMRKAF